MKSIAAGLHNAKDEQIGTVTISDTASGALEVKISAKGIEPGERAVHIHEFGKCEVPQFETAGGHLAGGKEHGAHSPGGMHSGDLPNVTADAEGNVEATFFTNNVTIDEIMDADGGSFIIHAGADDYTSQPSGDAGDRFACGVFEPSKG
ncbi:MAG: superoxide dismutase family protein [Paracoccus denitrificans]|nr:MAG: superoxide dismutase family protein [Paracoccus denitrificans]PZO82969.1 MAG: superoxide dismutase family protein [Paracoccus denitrificans]